MPRPCQARRAAIPLACAALLAITPGCGDPPAAQANPAYASRATGSRFLVGPPGDFAKPGVYTRFAAEHGVFLVSAHDMLVALADTCPNPEHRFPLAVRYDDLAGVFRCPACGNTFTSDGLAIANSTDRPNAQGEMAPGTDPPRSLDRCMIRSFGQFYDPQTPLEIDPRNRFHQHLNQWSEPGCLYPFHPAAPNDGGPKARNIRIGPILQ